MNEPPSPPKRDAQLASTPAAIDKRATEKRGTEKRPSDKRQQDKRQEGLRTEDKRSWLRKVFEFFVPGANSKDELIGVFASAEDKDIIGSETRIMLEGALRMAERTAGDVLVAAPRMDLICITDDFETILHQVIETGHSRFPVYEGETENIIGILMAKDLLKLQRAPELNLRALLRAPFFIPENKGLNDVLRDFRSSRNHLAIVIDEFGRIAGLVTIEDVVEEIVGEIEDEFDIPEDNGDIFGLADSTYRVSGDAPIARVNETFGTQIESEQNFDTIGGLVAHRIGHVPKRGETHELQGLTFTVLHSRGGVVKWFRVSKDEGLGAGLGGR